MHNYYYINKFNTKWPNIIIFNKNLLKVQYAFTSKCKLYL